VVRAVSGRRRWLALLKLTVFFALVGLLFWLLRYSPAANDFRSVASARRLVESMHPYDKPAFVAAYTIGALVLPGTLLSLVGAILYGPFLGTLLVWLGATLGSLPPYMLARIAGRPAVDSFLQANTLERFDRWIAERGFQGLLLVRLLPIFPYVIVNYACGLMGIKLRSYLIATAVGILPGTFVYQYLFSSVGERVLTDGLRWSYLQDPNILAPIGVFILFLLVGQRWGSQLRRRSTHTNGESHDPIQRSESFPRG
jgi:uncharacterized membrane protein YdjX (TVP38/TMEM64 family)